MKKFITEGNAIHGVYSESHIRAQALLEGLSLVDAEAVHRDCVNYVYEETNLELLTDGITCKLARKQNQDDIRQHVLHVLDTVIERIDVRMTPATYQNLVARLELDLYHEWAPALLVLDGYRGQSPALRLAA